MTEWRVAELEQAREHLRDCQKALQHARNVSVFEQGQWWPQNMKAGAERAVLAALSWVWDAQQRAEAAAVEWLKNEMQRSLLELLLSDKPVRYSAKGIRDIESHVLAAFPELAPT